MSESNAILNSSQIEWDGIKGYTSNICCPICAMDILVKTGVVRYDSRDIVWTLCHVCFDKGWQIPYVDNKRGVLIYFNSKTKKVEERNILYPPSSVFSFD